ncbi:MAG: hypothetical protein KJ626_11890, partial [Verrucomicrobia bacterium]|nr:hypothetical protein [Verrucomicrobiota bacterium]
YISVDPARDGLNHYAYVRNNPLRFVDPLGLAPMWQQRMFELGPQAAQYGLSDTVPYALAELPEVLVGSDGMYPPTKGAVARIMDLGMILPQAREPVNAAAVTAGIGLCLRLLEAHKKWDLYNRLRREGVITKDATCDANPDTILNAFGAVTEDGLVMYAPIHRSQDGTYEIKSPAMIANHEIIHAMQREEGRIKSNPSLMDTAALEVEAYWRSDDCTDYSSCATKAYGSLDEEQLLDYARKMGYTAADIIGTIAEEAKTRRILGMPQLRTRMPELGFPEWPPYMKLDAEQMEELFRRLPALE